MEALRCGTRVIAGELNPVAFMILKATLEYPSRFGAALAGEVQKWTEWINARAREELDHFYPQGTNERVLAYIWGRTIQCPSCGLMVILSPNWWLSREKGRKERVAVRLKIPSQGKGNEVSFEIIEDVASTKGFDPGKGSVSKSKATCPRCNNTIGGDYIKAEAQRLRMGQQLYALYIKQKTGPSQWRRAFRVPTETDVRRSL